MNKTVIAVLLLGLVVVAMAAEGKDKMQKLKMKKEKIMAKKERMHLDKLKKQIPELDAKRRGSVDKLRGMDSLAEKYGKLREQVESGTISREEFKEQARRLKDEAKRARAGAVSERKEAARKEGAKEGVRNKRAVKAAKNAARKIKSDNLKQRRSPIV